MNLSRRSLNDARRNLRSGAVAGRDIEPRGGPVRTNRCLESTAQTSRFHRVVWPVLLGLAMLAIPAFAVCAVISGVDLLATETSDPEVRRTRRSVHRASPSARPKLSKQLHSKKSKRPPPRYDWPVGTLSGDIALIATNIPPGNPDMSTAVLLDETADRYVMVFPGDKFGNYEVARISLDWVQLRRGKASSWVGYRKGQQRRTRTPSPAQQTSPREVRRRLPRPTVTFKWILGRLNLYGELEEHLQPTVSAKGVHVGKVTLGFRRIGMRVGDIVQRAGNRKVFSLDDIREGLQPAAQPGGSGSITVLRGSQTIELKFNVD